ncbi:hypothetical protein F5878DRAFT_359192 [Lentinula raphanica]|uniref:Uncharacterized protein n=1 Tax=Lentinula raphanica TaxID=153919 RepID=A0AA38PM39_9AGAR|nr:hypothetical protein F5878DRAFT_359192 [Lentinula raphanica]
MSGTIKTFHPQGRLPLDPFDIAEVGASVCGADTEKGQSERKPNWVIQENDVQDLFDNQRLEKSKIILVLGEPTTKELAPLINSQLLSNSLFILATQRAPADLPLILPKPASQGPALLILRLQPLPHPIPQQLHSILSRAEILARKWRHNHQSIFFEPEEERGRSRFRRNSKPTTDRSPIKVLQLSEIGGVFGRDFDVREEVGFYPETVPGIPSPPPSSSTMRPKSFLRAQAFTSTSIPKRVREQRAFDAIINFVPAGFHEADQESGFMQSISSISSASRAFLVPPTLISSNSDGRGRSLSKGSHRRRSSSIDRIREWVKSRSRSRSRNERNSEKISATSRSCSVTEAIAIGRQRQGHGSKSQAQESPNATPEDIKGKGPARNAVTAKKTERGVLTSWSRNQLHQANHNAQTRDGLQNGSKNTATFKAYLVHVLPLSPPTPAPAALLQTSFSGRMSTFRSQGSSGSALSSGDMEIPPLGAAPDHSEELRDISVLHTVPPAQEPESAVSSKAASLNAMTHSRTGSLDSMVPFSRSSSLGSLPTFKAALSLGNEFKKTPPTLVLTERLDPHTRSSAEGTFSPHLVDENKIMPGQADTSLEQAKLSVYRRASKISPALEAAVENATRYSLHSSGRTLSSSKSSMEIQLQRRSTAVQVASAAAIAALEISLYKAHEFHTRGRTGISDDNETPINGLPLVSQGHAGEHVGKNDTIDPDTNSSEVIATSTLSTVIPEALMPHPHRQHSLVLRDSAFDPLDVGALFQLIDTDFDRVHTAPISLLPRPHARARTHSLDGPEAEPSRTTKSSASSVISVAVSPQTSPPLSIPPSDPNFYYKKNDLFQELEKIALSFSYGNVSASPTVPISTLPKGAAKPATIGGSGFSELKTDTGNARHVEPQVSLIQGDHAIGSYLLPQPLLDVNFRLGSSSTQKFTFVDLILHGLLDPTPESICLYRDASLLANKLNPSTDASGGGNVTLNELLALGALNGEEAGTAHRMPKAWIGGIADVDIENAIPETSQFHTYALDNSSVATERGGLAAPLGTGSNSPVEPLNTSIFSRPLLSAVSLHSQTVAVSLREQQLEGDFGAVAPDTTDLSEPEQHDLGKITDGSFREAVPESRRMHTTNAVSHTAYNNPTPLNRTATSPELSSIHRPSATKMTHYQIPPGAAPPINPHLPNEYSTFPRHSVMFPKSISVGLPSDVIEQATGTSVGSGSDRVIDITDDDFSESVHDEQLTEKSGSEADSINASTLSISSDPHLDGAVPLPSVSSPLLDSPHSSNTGAASVTTSQIFSDETETLPLLLDRNGAEVAVLAVPVSDDDDSVDTLSVIIEPQPLRASLLLNPDPEQSTESVPAAALGEDIAIATSLDTADSPDIPDTPTGPRPDEPGATFRPRYSVRSASSANPDASPSTVEGRPRRESKLWLQRSPKPSVQSLPLDSPTRKGYFSGVVNVAPDERRRSRGSLLEESIFNIPLSTDSVVVVGMDDPPQNMNIIRKFSSLTHIRRRSTVPSTSSTERPLTMHGDEIEAPSGVESVEGADADKKPSSRRLSKAISWMVTDADSGPTYTLNPEDMVSGDGEADADARGGRSSKTSSTGSPVRALFTNLVASASASSLLSFSERGRRLSTSSASTSIKSGSVNVDSRIGAVNTSSDIRFPSSSPSISPSSAPAPAPAPAVIITPIHSPILSILSLPLNNLSDRSETQTQTPPQGHSALMTLSDSTSSSESCSTIPPTSISAGIHQRLLVASSSSPNLARRHSNSTAPAPIGPRPPKRSGSQRTIPTSTSSSSSNESIPPPPPSQVHSPTPTPQRPLPVPSLASTPVSMSVSKPIPQPEPQSQPEPELVGIDDDDDDHGVPLGYEGLEAEGLEVEGLGEDGEGVENLITPFPIPRSRNNTNNSNNANNTNSSNKSDSSSGPSGPSGSHSRPQSQSHPNKTLSSRASFSPLRKLAIDEVRHGHGTTTDVPRVAARPKTATGAGGKHSFGNGSPGQMTKTMTNLKWKFWGGGGSRPVSMTVDLTREI